MQFTKVLFSALGFFAVANSVAIPRPSVDIVEVNQAGDVFQSAVATAAPAVTQAAATPAAAVKEAAKDVTSDADSDDAPAVVQVTAYTTVGVTATVPAGPADTSAASVQASATSLAAAEATSVESALATVTPSFSSEAASAFAPAQTGAASNTPDGGLTINISNKHGQPLELIFNNGQGEMISPSESSQTIQDGESMQAVFGDNWSGNMAILAAGNSQHANFASLIEASTIGMAFYDVSYVNGFSVPITCSCPDQSNSRGCSDDLWAMNSCEGPLGGTSESPAVCQNPNNFPAATGAATFFEPCAGNAYTWPNDNLGTSGCPSGPVNCCIGASC